jgi:hypothetical protein
MASDVDLCNLALAHLGDEAEVTAINPPDGTAQAAQCGRFYPLARDALLEMHPWTFATTRVSLASLVDTSRPEWAYAYSLPAKCLKPLAVLPPDVVDDTTSYEYIVESNEAGTRILYTNVESATLRYIQRIEDTTKFTHSFGTALARLLASYLAGPIIKGTTGMQVNQAQLKLFAYELGVARTSDSNVGKRNTYRDRLSSTELARGGLAAGASIDQFGRVRGA